MSLHTRLRVLENDGEPRLRHAARLLAPQLGLSADVALAELRVSERHCQELLRDQGPAEALRTVAAELGVSEELLRHEVDVWRDVIGNNDYR